ncbi:MAG: hypothetical protein Q8M31_09685 [Beijerinckiaceae bacterium]|nr:hypothetical protein [Beijerinckiaceae bacterium]
MRQGISRFAALSKGPVALVALLALSGCGGGSYVGSLFGSGSSTPSTPTQPVASGQAPADGATQSAVLPIFRATGPTELMCPFVDVREGAAAHRVYAGPPSNANVRYQYSMGEIARECRMSGNQIVLKMGVEGRVLLGPAGSPGSFTVPVSIAVRDEKTRQYVANRTYRVAASIAQGAANTSFAVVSEEIAIPFKGLAANDDYTVYVGFDGASAATGTQPSRRRR